ncbi:ankyrin repeat domain-containing protein [Rhodohalobacter sp. 8-1]|uniref:ankyrin repeat domain-containing protein n=1 Tax=Rhodohalobacter sp. 8-1 TaxID=3131972 RepID=UPI0030EE1E0B
MEDKKGAKVNRSDIVGKWTPLMYAAAEGNHEVIELIFEHCANPKEKDSDGEKATDFAENNGHTQTVTLLDSSLTQ